jgi:transmembrane sensor
MNKENPKKNKKSFEYYIAQRKEEFRCQYDHERSWENLQYKLQKRKNHRLLSFCFLIHVYLQCKSFLLRE